MFASFHLLAVEILVYVSYSTDIINNVFNVQHSSSGTGIGITSDRKRHFGVALVRVLHQVWTSTILNLSLVPKTQPHAAYSASVHTGPPEPAVKAAPLFIGYIYINHTHILITRQLVTVSE